jgi:hypothetical protein
MGGVIQEDFGDYRSQMEMDQANDEDQHTMIPASITSDRNLS